MTYKFLQTNNLDTTKISKRYFVQSPTLIIGRSNDKIRKLRVKVHFYIIVIDDDIPLSLAILIHTLSVDKEITKSPNKRECG